LVGYDVTRYRLRHLFVAVFVLALILAAIKSFYDWQYRLSAEYATAELIREVTQYVEVTNGQWPKSWNDFPFGAAGQQYSKMRFDVEVQDLINDPNLIHSVIVPLSGEYHTYPHAERDLNHLRDTLIRYHK
jgi:hypothetical protein